MEILNHIIRFFQTGGLFMYPIVIILVLGFTIAIERYIHLGSAKRSNQKVWNALMPLFEKGDFHNARIIMEKSNTAIGKILNYGISRVSSSRRRDDINTAMEEGLMEVIPQLEKRTHYLATFANIATLLGLLGTIIGLIQAFTAVAAANPTEKADMLSASISVAMNTTAFGLIVAIPLLFMHAFLHTKTVEVVDSLEMASVKFLNILTERSKKAD